MIFNFFTKLENSTLNLDCCTSNITLSSLCFLPPQWINKAKKYNSAFIGLPPVDETKTLPFEETSFQNKRIKLFNDIIKEQCHQNNILFLDMFDLMSKEDYPKLLEDGLHPNSQGYDFMFVKIKDLIEKNNLI